MSASTTQKLILDISPAEVGEERDIADVLRSIASQIDEAVEYGDEFAGTSSAGDVTGTWRIEGGS